MNTVSEITQACRTLEPAATELTPKEKPKTPTAPLRVRQATIIGRNDRSRHHTAGSVVRSPDEFTRTTLGPAPEVLRLALESARYRRRVRVLMLSFEAPPRDTGAVAAHVDGLSRALVRGGHDVTIASVDTDENAYGVSEELVDGVRILRTAVRSPWIAESDVIAFAASASHQLVALLPLLGTWVPDVIHTHDWRSAWAARTLATVLDRPLVVTFHSTELGRHAGMVPVGLPASIHAVEWWLALAAEQVICCSQFMLREMLSGFELSPDSVHLVPNGVAVERWAPQDPSQTRAPLVLAWGRVQYEKGFQVLAQAISRLRGPVPGITCVIAGRGPYLPELQSQVDIEGVQDLVHLAGYVSDDELRELLHRAGCVVIPSLYEPFGVVALEAMAAGAPTVVARTGGLAEIMQGTGAGLLFEPGNAVELAEAIQRVLTDPALAADLQTHAREVLRSRYSWEAIAQSTAAVYARASDR